MSVGLRRGPVRRWGGWLAAAVVSSVALVGSSLVGMSPAVAAPRGVQLSEAVPRTEVVAGDSVDPFRTVAQVVSYRGGRLLLSSSGDGAGKILTDDAFTIRVRPEPGKGPGKSMDIDFSEGCTGLRERPAPDVSKLFRPGPNHVTLLLRDRCGVAYSSRPYFLSGKVTLVQPLDGLQFGPGRNPGWHDDPLNVATGNFARSEVDLGFPEHVFGLEWGRTYNSGDDRVGVFGQGWWSSFEARVDEDEGGSVWLVEPSGRMVEFVPVGDGFGRAAGFDGMLSRAGDGSFTVAWSSGESWSFDGSGRLVGKANWDGGRVVLSYEADRLVAVAGGYGYGVRFGYDGAGRLVEAAASDGRTVAYGYEADLGVVRVTDPAGGVTAYGYDEDGRLAEVVDADGRRVVALAYDEEGRVAEQVAETGSRAVFSYDPGRRVTSVRDEGTDTTVVYAYDEFGQVVSSTDPSGHATTRAYDPAGNVISGSQRSGEMIGRRFDARGEVTGVATGSADTSFTYDDQERLTSATAPDGGMTRFAYEGSERLPSSVVDAAGGVTGFDIDAGRVVAVTDPDGVRTGYGYDPAGNLITVTDGSGAVSRFEYDPAGRLVATVSPLGATERREYDPAGRLTRLTDAAGATTRYRYSPGGLLVEVTDPTGAVNTLAYNDAGLVEATVDEAGARTGYGYDDAGNRTSITDPLGRVTRYEWDALNRLVAEVDPAGAATRYVYGPDGEVVGVTDPVGSVTRFEYDERGRRLSATDPTGAATRFAYDEMDRLTATTDPTGAVRTVGYDPLGRVVAETDPLGAVSRTAWTPAGRLAGETDPLGRVTRYAYDRAGQPVSVTSPSGGVSGYAYDPDGRTVAETSPAGLVTRFGYDPAGRLVETVTPGDRHTTTAYSLRGERITETRPGGSVRRFEYDPVGRMVAAIDANGGTTSYTYDLAGQLTAVTDAEGGTTRHAYDPAGRRTERTDPLGRTTRQAYDPAGRLQTRTLPTGERVDHEYDPAGRRTSRRAGDQTIRYDYDPAGRRTTMDDPTGTTAYVYDRAGQLVSLGRPDGSTFTSGYDPAGQATTLGYPSGRQVSSGYDPDGRLVRLDVTGPRTAAGAIYQEFLPKTIAYHPEGPVSAASAPAPPEPLSATFDVDPDGRLLAEHLPGGLSRTYHYTDGLLDRFTQTGGQTKPGTVTLERNPDGQITAETTGGHTVRYGYDPAGQLTTTTGAPDGPVTVTHDATGNRTRRTHGQATTTYDYDAAHQLLTAHHGRNTTSYRWDDAGRLIGETGPGVASTTTSDPFGRPASHTTTRGTRTETSTWTADGDDLLTTVRTAVRPRAGAPEKTSSQTLLWGAGAVPEILSKVGADHDTELVYGYQRLLALSPDHSAVFAADQHQSALATPATSDLTQAAAYDPFGTPDDQRQTRPAFGYRGELALDGLVYLRARLHQPQTGRFTTPDPLPGLPGDVTAANPYPYANNDPLNQTDPLGLRPSDASFKCRPGWEPTALKVAGQKFYECRPPKLSLGDFLRTFVETIGIIPGIGDVADGILCASSLVTRNYKNAAYDCIAIIPAAGNAARVARHIDDAADTIKHTDNAIDTARAAKKARRALPRSSLPSPSEAADIVRAANPAGSALSRTYTTARPHSLSTTSARAARYTASLAMTACRGF